MELVSIGTVHSPLKHRDDAPKQGDEGAPEAWLEFEPAVADGLEGIGEGDELLVLTWLDRAERDVLRVNPRNDRRAASRACSARARPTGRTRSGCIA